MFYSQCRWIIGWIVVLVGLCWPMVAMATGKTPPPSDVSVTLDATVVYCDTYSDVPRNPISTLLQEGAIVSSSWQISLQRQRKYWLNEDIGNIEIIHQVTPDLIARRWILLDVSTGISKTTRSLSSALDFLLQLNQVPVVDVSLLHQLDELAQEPGHYLVRTRLFTHDGVINPAEWRSLLRLGKTVGIREFTLP